MRKISIFIIFVMLLTIYHPVKAESYMEWRKRDPEGFYAHFTCTDEETKANGCYTEYGKDWSVTVDVGGSQNNSSVNRGYVNGDDELHVVGYPTDSEGYSINPSYSGESKGYVFPEDELHVIGLPTDERGYTKAGNYGRID